MNSDSPVLLNEIAILKKLSHPNIVQYIGTYIKNKEAYIVMEYLPLGGLNTLLMNEGKKFTTYDLTIIAKQVAEGMLELEKQRIIHRDVALRNVLVGTVGEDKRYLAKISDFGLSRSIESSYYVSKNNIPLKWSAPEVLEFGSYTTKADVYSFGVVVWEIFSLGRMPYYEYTYEVARKMILKGQKLPCPEKCPPAI